MLGVVEDMLCPFKKPSSGKKRNEKKKATENQSGWL
jgi:hypothetical protein